MIQTPTDVERPPYTTEQLAARLQEIKGYPWGVRAALAKQCQVRGHVPIGDQIVVGEARVALDCCFRCGSWYDGVPQA